MTIAKGRKPTRSSGAMAGARTGLFRATLLFGSLVGALALIAVPEADRRSRLFAAEAGVDLDPISTGSIDAAGGGDRYRMLRSVLHRPDAEPCIVFPNGRQKGAC